MISIDPFLRWVGGKNKMKKKILPYLPEGYRKFLYVEPFVGAGSIFFAINSNCSVISDINKKLINCYHVIKVRPQEVCVLLNNLMKNDSAENYYTVRKSFNKSVDKVQQAAQFIYLNKSSFNGIYRVNKKGEYNVPYGYKKKLTSVDLAEFIKISEYMKNTEIVCCSYKKTQKYAGKKTFYYLDPPYPPINGTSFFTHYTENRFDKNDQESLMRYAEDIAKKGAKVMITNADLPFIRELYKDWNIDILSTVRWVSSKKNKYKVNELVIRNY